MGSTPLPAVLVADPHIDVNTEPGRRQHSGVQQDLNTLNPVTVEVKVANITRYSRLSPCRLATRC